MYVGIGPVSPEDEAAILPDYIVLVIEDDAKYDWVLEHVQWPPYAHLAEDDETFDLVDDWPGG